MKNFNLPKMLILIVMMMNILARSSNQRDSSNECNNVDKINSNEITYLLNHQRSARLPLRVDEPEELLFDDNGELDILKALDIRESHNAFSRADRLRGIR